MRGGGAAARRRRREMKRQAAERVPLAGRRAYRAAQAVLAQGLKLWKTADNKTRLALMLLGPLNLLLLALLANPEIFAAIPSPERLTIVIGVIAYAGLVMTVFLLAIGTLRPEEAEPPIAHGRRQETPSRRSGSGTTRTSSLGPRVPAARARDPDSSSTRWRSRRRSQANRQVPDPLLPLRGSGMTALAVALIVGIAGTLMLKGRRSGSSSGRHDRHDPA